MLSTTPSKNKNHIRAFCKEVCLGQKASYVLHQPLTGKQLKECFSIVPEHVEANGGKQIFGWAIFELPRIWLEAEFHAVWERPDSKLIDLTPREIPMERILFIPDPKNQYEGVQVNSIIKPISGRKSVAKFIELSRSFHEALNEGDLAKVQRGLIHCPKAARLQREMDQLMGQILIEHYS